MTKTGLKVRGKGTDNNYRMSTVSKYSTILPAQMQKSEAKLSSPSSRSPTANASRLFLCKMLKNRRLLQTMKTDSHLLSKNISPWNEYLFYLHILLQTVACIMSKQQTPPAES